MACSQSNTTFPAGSINRGCSVVIPPASRARANSNPSFPNSISFGSLKTSRFNLRCNSSGENGCKSMLDAFLLGKAFGEILNQRIESSVGEFLGVIGRLQSEQLKHVSQFQEEVLEKARRAKEEATLGLVSDATSTVKEATQQAEELISEAAEQAREEARGLVSDAASTASSIAASVISEASSSVLNRATEDPFLGP